MSHTVGSGVARRRWWKLFCAGAGVFGALVRGVKADTAANWDGSNNNWSSAADWSSNPFYPSNGTPAGTSYAVTINSGVATLDVSATIDSLVVGDATLQADTGKTLTSSSLNNSGYIYFTSNDRFTVNGPATNAQNVFLGSGSTLSLSGSVTNTGTLFTGYGGGNDALSIGGTLNNTGTFSMNTAGDVAAVNALSNHGTVAVDAGTTLNITGGGLGVTDIPTGTEYSLTGIFNVINGGVGTDALANLNTVEGYLYLLGHNDHLSSFSNSGNIYIGIGSTLTLSGNLTNTATFYTGYAGGNDTVNVNGTLTNSGTLSLNSQGDVVNVNLLINQGTVETAAGTTLNITGGGLGITDIPLGSVYSIDGNFNVINGGVASDALAHLAGVEGTLYLLDHSDRMGSFTDSGTVYLGIGATLTLTGNLTNTGTFYMGYAGGNDTLSVNGTLTNSGTLSLNDPGDIVNVGVLNNKGNLETAAGTTFNITGGGLGVTDIPLGSTYSLGGNFNVINGGVASNALAHLGTVEGLLYLLGENEHIGSLTDSGSIYLGVGSSVTVTGNLTNTATLYMGYAQGNDTLSVSGTLTNSGTFSLNAAGDVADVGVLNNQGTVEIGAGTTLNIAGGGMGVTDIPLGSEIAVAGSLNVINGGVTSNGLAHLGSVEGELLLLGQNDTMGSLTNSGSIYIGIGSTLSLTGSITNTGTFYTGYTSGNNSVSVAGTFNNTGGLTLSSTGDVVSVNALNNPGSIGLAGGTTLNVTGGSNTVYGPGNGSVNVSGTLTNTGTLNTGGTLTVFNTGRVNINGGSINIGGLSVAGGGVMNVNATLAISYGSPSADPIATILGYLANGYAGGAWTGTSISNGVITSSAAAAAHGGSGPAVTLGYADSAADGNDAQSVFGLGANQVLVRYVQAGDANLDGRVNFTDYSILIANFGKTGTDWAHGNFLYGPGTNFGDYSKVIANFGLSLPPAGGMARIDGGGTISLAGDARTIVAPGAVPEPGCVGLLMAGAAGVLARRRRARAARRIVTPG